MSKTSVITFSYTATASRLIYQSNRSHVMAA